MYREVRGVSHLQSQLALLLLDLVTLCTGGIAILGLHLGSLKLQAFVDLFFGSVAASDGLVHEALGVTFFEGGDDLFARYH